MSSVVNPGNYPESLLPAEPVIQEVEISATVTRPDGTVINYGIIATTKDSQ